MKAWVLEDIDNLVYRDDVDMPVAKSGQAIIKVMAAGICGSDIPRAYRNGAHRMPLILGHEFAGQVVSVGDDSDKPMIGKRVGVFPLIPCGHCEACSKNAYEMCSSYDYLGSRCDGGFAEYVAVPVWNLIELPDNVSYEQAAMLEPMAVVVHAMRRMDISKEYTVTVCGLGTIGQLLIMFLKAAGIDNIYAIGSKDSQRDSVIGLGILPDNYCDSKSEDVISWHKSKTNGRGTDIFFECVGKNDTVNQAIELTAIAGQICLVGNPYGEMQFDKELYWKILRRQLILRGTWNSSFGGNGALEDDWHYVIESLQSELIHPERLITHRFALENLNRGFELMRDKSEDYVKVMTTHGI